MASPIESKDIVQAGGGSLLNINWELVSHCQFNCSYCYYRPFKSDTDYKTLSTIILKKLEGLQTDAKVTLLGGEPSLHPRFLEVVETLWKNDRVKEIAIVTNFKRKGDIWSKLIPFKDKVKIVLSWHAEYVVDDFFDKLDSLIDRVPLDFVFVVHPSMEYLERMKTVARKAQEEKYFSMSLNFVPVHGGEGGDKDYVDYPEEIESFIREQQELTRSRGNVETLLVKTKAGEIEMPKFEVLKSGLNQFKGWECRLGAYIIHENGMVTKACSKETKHILTTKFEHGKLKCPYRICECDDYWSFEKFNNA